MANNGRVHTHDKRGKSYGQDNSHQMAAESSGNRKQGKDKKPQAHHESNVKACHITDQKKLCLLPMIPLQLVAGALGLAAAGAGASIIGSLPPRRGEFQFPRIPLYQPRIEQVQWISGTGNGSKEKPEEKDKEKEKEKEKKEKDETKDESKPIEPKPPRKPRMPRPPRKMPKMPPSSSSESEDESSSSSNNKDENNKK